ncbi:hypothetical protein [Desulfovibrio sp. JC022]|uniref:hypothetical protein n=1 Tax=Desulfovibrio sp. JC022 TaxID=2593642 RepID=UPI0013D5BE8C|nr:hypothetical protein [Desulfovibrio sp. JC022]NDV24196.1 hypothetical protein [Desulfovibrio sp. JC022]
MKIASLKGGNVLTGQGFEGLLGAEKEQMISPELERLSLRESLDPALLQRARDREEEERDLRVLDAYNRFESGLQEILANPESGLMILRAGDAQSAVFKVNDYFAEEGGRLRDALPDDDCRTRFMDILESRRKTAVDTVARHQSQEYQNWKEHTAAETIDSVLKAVNLSPDAASLMHGERLLEGAILRLYRGSNPELLQLRLITAKQAMYAGALEKIGMKDPVSALILCESWKNQLGEGHFERLYGIFEPQARNQHMKQEFHSLRHMDEEQLEAELEDLKDADMRRELSEMLIADRELRQRAELNAEDERTNITFRELFKRFADGNLTVESILDSGLEPEMRSMWLLIFSRKGEKGSDETLLKVVQGVINDEISEEYQIYAAIVDGLGETDVSMLAALFMLKDNPESRLMVNGLLEINERCESVSGDQRDQAAAIRDFMYRVAVLVSKGEPFSVTKVRNEVLADHLGNGQGLKSEPFEDRAQKSSELIESTNDFEETDHVTDEVDEPDSSIEDETEQLSKKDDEGYPAQES